MTEQLPIRLGKGDPAPEDCVAVPLHGPGGPADVLWGDIVTMLDVSDYRVAQTAVQVIADAAKAPLPLRKGDRVEINAMIGTLDSINYEDRTGVIRWDDEWAPFSLSVPFAALTSIDDEPCPNCDGRKCMACVTRETHPGKCVDDCPDCCAGDTTTDLRLDGPTITELCNADETPGLTTTKVGELTTEDVQWLICAVNLLTGMHHAETIEGGPEAFAGMQTALSHLPTIDPDDMKEHAVESRPDWTPTEGQLVERISDGLCFRFTRKAREKGKWGLQIAGDLTDMIIDDVVLYRPRFLRVGDVIDKITTPRGFTYLEDEDAIIQSVTPDRVVVEVPEVTHYASHCIVRIEGLGPVPWPPTVEEADR